MAADAPKSLSPEQQQELDDVFARAQKALAIIETYDQARVDRLCQAVAWAVANHGRSRASSRWGSTSPGSATPAAAWASG